MAKPFRNGRFEDQLLTWSSAADRWKEVLCEGMMKQVVDSALRPSTDDSFFAEPAWPAIVEQGIEWLLRAASITGPKEEDAIDDEDFKQRPRRKVGDDLENAIVHLAAEAVVHAPSDSWANMIISKFLALPGKRHGAREAFAVWFASHAMGGADDKLPAKAINRWTSFATTVLGLDEGDSEADELPKAALGLSLLSQYSWPEQATQAAIALASHFESWVKSFVRDTRDAATFAYFLMCPAAATLQLNGIEWLASNPKFTEPQRWRHESDRQPLISLLESVSSSIPLGQQSPSVRDAMVRLVSALAAAGDGRAVDLQRSLGITV